MSIFGFGSSYNPNSYGSGSPTSNIAQTVPGYVGSDPSNGGPNAGAGGVNWGMSANNPLSGWGTMTTGYDVNRHGGAQGWVDQLSGNSAGVNPEKRRLAYNNPLQGLFGDNGMVNLGDNQGANQYISPTWTTGNFGSSVNTTGNVPQPARDFIHSNGGGGAGIDAATHDEWQAQYHNPGGVTFNLPYQTYGGQDPYKNEFATNGSDPNSFQGLYSRMNGISDQQLQSLSNNIGSAGGPDSYRAGGSGPAGSGIFGAFQQAQQNVMNNYANGQYRSYDPMSQNDSLNWLQASYNTLTNRLNQNGLL